MSEISEELLKLLLGFWVNTRIRRKSLHSFKAKPRKVRLSGKGTRDATSKPGAGPKSAGKKRRRFASNQRAEEEIFADYHPRGGTLIRTRRLILAAVRLWELKRGIRD